MFNRIPQILKRFSKKNKELTDSPKEDGRALEAQLLSAPQINNDGTIALRTGSAIQNDIADTMVHARSQTVQIPKAPWAEAYGLQPKNDQAYVNRILKGDVSEGEQVAIRESQRRSITKWFSKERSDSGSFDARELQERIEENARREQADIAPLPLIEDTFIAFSRAEDDPFSERSISISGVFQIVHLKGEEDTDEDEDCSITIAAYREDEVLASLNRSYSAAEAMHLDEQYYREDDEVYYLPEKGDPADDYFGLEASCEDIAEANEPVPETHKETYMDSIYVGSGIACLDLESGLYSQLYLPMEASDSVPDEVREFEPASEDCREPNLRTSNTASISQALAHMLGQLIEAGAAKKVETDYWNQSQRLNRIGRTRTTAACSSIRTRLAL